VTFPPLRLAYNPRALGTADKKLSLVPYITSRKGEDAAPDTLIVEPAPGGPRLAYADEDGTAIRRVCATSRGLL
jgi:hypothetical protein